MLKEALENSREKILSKKHYCFLERFCWFLERNFWVRNTIIFSRESVLICNRACLVTVLLFKHHNTYCHKIWQEFSYQTSLLIHRFHPDHSFFFSLSLQDWKRKLGIWYMASTISDYTLSKILWLIGIPLKIFTCVEFKTYGLHVLFIMYVCMYVCECFFFFLFLIQGSL